MQLIWMLYNHNAIMALQIAESKSQIIALKIFHKQLLVNNQSVIYIRQNISMLNKLNTEQLISMLKYKISNFNTIYRTYSKHKCTILKTYPILSL